jgi:Holliday junction resolvase RusA-like endonuclease
MPSHKKAPLADVGLNRDANDNNPPNRRADECHPSTDMAGNANFIVYGRPKPCERPRFSAKTKRTFNSKTYTDAKKAFRDKAKVTAPFSPPDGPVHLSIDFLFPLPKKGKSPGDPYMATPDIDNLEKLVLDALNGLYYDDDRQVISLVASKRYSDIARTEVSIKWEQKAK